MPNGEPTEPEEAPRPGPSLEQRVSIFDSIGKSLEDLVGAVRAIPTVIKEAAYYTYYTAKAVAGVAAGVALAGCGACLLPYTGLGGLITNIALKGYHAIILPIGIAAGTLLANWKKGEKKTFKETYKQIANEVAVGGILGGLLHNAFLGVNHIGNIVESAYGTPASLAVKGGCALAHLPPFLATHEYLNRALIRDYEPKPLKDMWKKIKGPLKWLIPPIVASFTVVPYYFYKTKELAQMTMAGINSTAYGLLKAEPKKKEEKPQVAPAGYGQPQLAGAPGYG